MCIRDSFRFATLDADDFYTVCAALIMENGGRAAAMQDAYAAAYNRRCGDAFLFIYECLAELVDTASVSYTHLDVYKRQLLDERALPLAFGKETLIDQSLDGLADGDAAHTCLLYTSRCV